MENGTPAQKEIRMNILEAQIRECFRRVVYSHKTHEKCVDQVFRLHKRLKFLSLVLSAVTTTSILTKISGDGDTSWALYTGAVVSTVLFGLNAYTKDYDLGEVSQKHKDTANQLRNMREKYLSLLTEIKMGLLTVDQVLKRREELQQELDHIYTTGPRTDSPAYKKANASIERIKKGSSHDDEIDLLLPRELRRNPAAMPDKPHY